MKRRIEIMLVGLAVILLAGCRSENKRTWDTLVKCRQDNSKLSIRIQELETQKAELTERVQTLSGLDAKTRFETLDTLEKIRIGKRTGFYSKDKNSAPETLTVYLEPVDTAQDTVKAVGKVVIELWDLNAPEDKAKLNEWTLEPDQLHKSWGGNIFSSYYRIKLPLEFTPEQHTEYTLKVTFTDYLSGKVLTDQKVIVAKD